MNKYDHKNIERKWQKYWKGKKIYKTKDGGKKPKCFVLDMFPYLSGEGLHVGHPRGYIATDVYSRFKRMNGFNVLHPMGFDSFGLPAENYAIKNKIHPEVAVKNNVKKFKSQLELIGFDYDWDREIITSDPNFYKWTQWVFLKMFEKGLAYESYEPINFCPSCLTGLANEDVEDGKCERCATPVVKKPMRQWVLKITDYAERMLEDLNELKNWPEHIKESQRNWIGKSEGTTVKFEIRSAKSETNQKSKIQNPKKDIEVFTTRIDTIFGVTYLVVAPENKIIEKLKEQIKNWSEVEKYIVEARNKSELQRTELAKEKTGVDLKGVKAINPFNSEEVSVWTADYVLGGYGTGAVMAVPAHDERDWEFAKKYNLPIKEVIEPLFKTTSGPDTVVENLPMQKRDTVVCIVKHWSEYKYICLKWKKYDWKTFVVGGTDGEDSVKAGLREIKEETGYTSSKFIKKLGNKIHNQFFAHHKNENRWAVVTPLYFELENGKKTEVDQKENETHDVVWVNYDEVLNYLYDDKSDTIFWNRMIGKETSYTGDGILIDSGEFSGLDSKTAREKMTKWLEEKKLGGRKINYKLKDWVFSRQRYWGEPIPLVFCENCAVKIKSMPADEAGKISRPQRLSATMAGVANLKTEYSKGELLNPGWIIDKDLPVKLPKVKFYEPTDTGESPLAKMEKWVNVKCPKCGGKGKRETNTMPQWAGSSWYYLRYIDSKNKKALIDGKKEKYWSPVDMYVGGAEHATRHLIYARFWHKFLFDIGIVKNKEPFSGLKNQGLIMGNDGRKMSKRWGNIVNPDDVVAQFGADTLRVYEMFMGPFDQPIAWSTDNMIGSRRFLEKVFNLKNKISRPQRLSATIASVANLKSESNAKLERLLHQTIKKVTEDIENFRFNTAISSLMILVNEMEKAENFSKETYYSLLILLSPFAPHITDELWFEIGGKKSVHLEYWVKFDESKIESDEINIVVQINGKVRANFTASKMQNQKEIENLALSLPEIKKWVRENTIKKIFFIKNKVVSIVV